MRAEVTEIETVVVVTVYATTVAIAVASEHATMVAEEPFGETDATMKVVAKTWVVVLETEVQSTRRARSSGGRTPRAQGTSQPRQRGGNRGRNAGRRGGRNGRN